MIGAGAISTYAPRALDYMQELERMPEQRLAILHVQSDVTDLKMAQAKATEQAGKDAEQQRAVLMFVLEHQVSVDAADAEPDRRKKVAAASAARIAFREAAARPHTTLLEAVAIARSSRPPR